MLKNYKPRAIETLAQNALKHYNEELVCGEPCEIPIEELIEFHFGIIVQYRNLSKMGRFMESPCLKIVSFRYMIQSSSVMRLPLQNRAPF